MRLNKIIVRGFVAGLILSTSSYAAMAKCRADITNADNEVYWVNDDNKLIPLQSVGLLSDVFTITEDRLGNERKLRFVGHIKDFEHNTPAVVKVSAWSDDKEAQDTRSVFISSNKTVRAPGIEPNQIYEIPLHRYQKHHRFGTRYDHSELQEKFHYGYRDKDGEFRSTDDTSMKRRKFNFAGVPNTSTPGILYALSRIIFTPVAAGTGKYVYLRSVLQNLKRKPCFSFSVSFPNNTDRVRLEVLPLDLETETLFKRKIWRFRKPKS